MSSNITCVCGSRLQKNLFVGAHAFVVVEDEVLESVDENGSGTAALDKIVSESDILLRCGNRGRIAIEKSRLE